MLSFHHVKIIVILFILNVIIHSLWCSDQHTVGGVTLRLCNGWLLINTNTTSSSFPPFYAHKLKRFLTDCVINPNCPQIEGPITNSTCRYIATHDDIYLCFNPQLTHGYLQDYRIEGKHLVTLAHIVNVMLV